MRKQGKQNKGKKRGNGQFGAPGRHLGAIWAPLQGGGALGTPVGAIDAQAVPVGATWAPHGRHSATKIQLSRN